MALHESNLGLKHQTLLAYLATSFRENSGRTACICERESLTYQQLNEQSDQLADELIRRGVAPGDRIGICIRKSCKVLVAVLAALKARAVFVPFDPDYPVDRLRAVSQDANLAIMLTERELRKLVSQFCAKPLELDTEWEAIASHPSINPSQEGPCLASEPAYMIYTSGSTGAPKGVVVGNASLANFVESMLLAPGFKTSDILLSASTLAFDISIYDLFVPLAVGGRIVFVDRGVARDGRLLADSLRDSQATHMFATPTGWRMLIEAGWEGDRRHFIALTGGEQLTIELAGKLHSRVRELWNFYGPTEATVLVTRQKVEENTERIFVGKAIENTELYLVDDQNELVEPEQPGELLIAGQSLAIGYWNQPTLQSQRFVSFQGKRVYRTGDLCKRTVHGEVEFLGRMDDQVKIRGHRIELGEVELVLEQYPGVKRAAVALRMDSKTGARLVAYIIPEPSVKVEASDLTAFVASRLPEYMVPRYVLSLSAFPETPNGKLDRKALPAPSMDRPSLTNDYIAPQSEWDCQLESIWSEVLGVKRIGVDDNFFQLGGNSLLVMQMLTQVERSLGWRIPAATVFDNPTISKLVTVGTGTQLDSKAVEKAIEKSAGIPSRARTSALPGGVGAVEIAIVGMAARFPGAKNIDEYWNNLIQGVDSIRHFQPSELDNTVSQSHRNSGNYVAARGVIDHVCEFDASFFGLSPKEAELMDPQQRLLLELAWVALEDAGLSRKKNEVKVGVWAGCFSNTYYLNNILLHSDLVEQIGEFQLATFTEKDFIASRIAHHLDLRGPAINVNTACSTSLVAVIEACQGILQGNCDIALAGGATVVFPQKRGHLYQEGNILSPDGKCKPFDSQAKGTLFSDGAGIVVLKRLEDAIRDGDRIYSVIKGLGINNDGGAKASFSAPSIEGQAGAISMAYRMSGFEADSIGYIEAHGTATPIGDPIEVAALTQVYHSEKRTTRCAIGSVKSNIGHTVAAAGIAGLIKAALALHHEVIPATIHFQKANPALELEKTPFYVCDRNQAWPRLATESGPAPRRAGVSSFGVGGTNAHILIEESPVVPADLPSDDEPIENELPKQDAMPLQIWTYSAKNETALSQYGESIAAFANAHPQADPAAIGNSFQRERQVFGHRAFVICGNSDEAAESIKKADRKRVGKGKVTASAVQNVWMFPGQGSQYVGMGKDLYEHVAVFRQTMDDCSEILLPWIGTDLRGLLYPAQADKDSASKLLRLTQYTQPALFAVSYSLAKTWMAWGVKPDRLIGHSVGEFAAACLAGVFSLQDGLRLIAKRGELLQALPNGSMLAVCTSSDEVLPRLVNGCEIAAINSPQLCVVAGPNSAIQQLEKDLNKENIACRPLMTSHAFHSSMMDGAVRPFTDFADGIELNAPQLPIRSTVTGQWLTNEQAKDPGYWGRHLRSTVQFSQAIDAMLQENTPSIFLEVGPRSTLVNLAQQHRVNPKNTLALLASLNDQGDRYEELTSMLQAAGSLWCNGVPVLWEELQPKNRRKTVRDREVRIPGYPFQRKLFWIEPKVSIQNELRPPLLNISTPSPSKSTSIPVVTPPSTMNTPTVFSIEQRKKQIQRLAWEVIENISGVEIDDSLSDSTFMELGVNSLMLTQTASSLQREFGVSISFRQLLEETPTTGMLVEWLCTRLPTEKFAEPIVACVPIGAITEPMAEPMAEPVLVSYLQPPSPNTPPLALPNGPINQVIPFANISSNDPLIQIVQQQMQLMQMHMQLLLNAGTQHPVQNKVAVQNVIPVVAKAPSVSTQNCVKEPSPSTFPAPILQADASASRTETSKSTEVKKVFGAQARVSLQAQETDQETARNLSRFIQQYNEHTPKSKEYAQEHRKLLADPRTVSGFQPSTKEMTYPIVVERSKGAYVWDIDGNQYVDLTSGFGSNFFGHSPDFMVQALTQQLSTGYEIGPQSVLTGEVAKLFCEMTGNERVAFCNTGSEAVLGAMRLARTVTDRDKFVMFTGDYHGILDEVIVRSNKKLVSMPAAPGIPTAAVQNAIVLEYGSEEALDFIAREKDQLAAVIVESVQSRRPDYQPKEFIRKLRMMTENEPTALIFDEVITGFRLGHKGAQAYYGVEADLATYGKVIGGGMPIGVLAGRAKYMDALDGGFWQFGDSSRPEVGMTYFAGTFVRHPLALAAAKQTLLYLKSQGDEAYKYLQRISDRLEFGMAKVVAETGAPIKLARCFSMIKPEFTCELPLGDLLFAAMRKRGIHIWEHRVCFLTLAHKESDIDLVINAFRESIIETKAYGFLPCSTTSQRTVGLVESQAVPPQLGKDRQGNPAWFVPDAMNPGQFLLTSPPSSFSIS